MHANEAGDRAVSVDEPGVTTQDTGVPRHTVGRRQRVRIDQRPAAVLRRRCMRHKTHFHRRRAGDDVDAAATA